MLESQLPSDVTKAIASGAGQVTNAVAGYLENVKDPVTAAQCDTSMNTDDLDN